MRPVPDTIAKPTWADGGSLERWDEPRVKSPTIIERMRRTGREAADTLAMLGTLCQPGVTTEEIDIACHERRSSDRPIPARSSTRAEAEPPFPKSLCTSVNE